MTGPAARFDGPSACAVLVGPLAEKRLSSGGGSGSECGDSGDENNNSDDNAWCLLVADTGNHRIRRVAPDGAVTTFAGGGGGGGGSAPGTGTTVAGGADGPRGGGATFDAPRGVAVASDGTVYASGATLPETVTRYSSTSSSGQGASSLCDAPSLCTRRTRPPPP